MEPLLYANLTRKTLSTSLAGPSLDWADFIQGDEMRLSLRLTQTINGEDVEIQRTVTRVVAALGRVDARATSGAFALKLAGRERVFTADFATDTLAATAHGFVDGDRLKLISTDTLPAPLASGVIYFVVTAAANTFQLAETSGGAAIVLADAGTGTQQAEQLTAGVSYDDQSASAAQDLQSAINGLADVGVGKLYPDCEVEMMEGSWLVRFPGEVNAVDLVVAANSLRPISFVRELSYQLDGDWLSEFRLVQAPIAFADSFQLAVPPEPTITGVQDGGENGSFKWNEVQAVHVPPNFRGTYQINRGIAKSELLSVEDGPSQILAAIEKLRDVGGSFKVENSRPNVAHIEFLGAMAGEDQDLLTVSIFDAPPGDITFEFELNKAAAAAILRTADDTGLELPLELQLTYEDPQDALLSYKETFRSDVTLRKELIWDGLATTPNLDWLRLPLPVNYIPFNPSQVITGSQHWAGTFGDAALSVFDIVHGLNTTALHLDVMENATPGRVYVKGVDYDLDILTADSVRITILNAVPGVAALAAVISSAGPTSAFVAGILIEIGQVNGLQLLIDDIGARLQSLESFIPAKISASPTTTGGVVAAWEFPAVFRLFPILGEVVVPESGEFSDIDLLDADIFPGGLLPAVHVASVLNVVPLLLASGDLPDPAALYVGKVYENMGVTPIDIFAGGGQPSDELKAGQYVACDGEVWYKVNNYGVESSYYPVNFDHSIFEIPITERQLRVGTTFESDFAIKLAMLNSESAASCVLVCELGESPADTSPGSPGGNLKDVIWDVDNPVLSHQILVGPVAGVHRFGNRIVNDVVDGLSLDNLLYGGLEVGDGKPDSANFWIRYRLIRWDTENSIPNPSGIVALSGPRAVVGSDSLPEKLGLASIK